MSRYLEYATKASEEKKTRNIKSSKTRQRSSQMRVHTSTSAPVLPRTFDAESFLGKQTNIFEASCFVAMLKKKKKFF